MRRSNLVDKTDLVIKFFGTGVVVAIPKGKFEMITADDLAKATPAVQPGDILIINTGWHKNIAIRKNILAAVLGWCLRRRSG